MLFGYKTGMGHEIIEATYCTWWEWFWIEARIYICISKRRGLFVGGRGYYGQVKNDNNETIKFIRLEDLIDF